MLGLWATPSYPPDVGIHRITRDWAATGVHRSSLLYTCVASITLKVPIVGAPGTVGTTVKHGSSGTARAGPLRVPQRPVLLPGLALCAVMRGQRFRRAASWVVQRPDGAHASLTQAAMAGQTALYPENGAVVACYRRAQDQSPGFSVLHQIVDLPWVHLLSCENGRSSATRRCRCRGRAQTTLGLIIALSTPTASANSAQSLG
jgi:hypothetical protein